LRNLGYIEVVFYSNKFFVAYYLKVYDNFHYMEEDEVYYLRDIKTPEEALKKAKDIVESYFRENWKPGMDHGTVRAMYAMYGEDPVIFSESEENVKFSARTYAQEVALRIAVKGASTQEIYQLIIRYVAEKHKDQKLPGTDLPYLVHLCNVAMEIILAAPHSKQFNLDFALKIALLHDVLEDTTTTSAEIESIFGTEVLGGVLSLTKTKNLPKEERMLDSLSRIKRQPQEVWAVKMADRITNLQPAPPDWTTQKKEEYAQESLLILDNLFEGNPYLGMRLKNQMDLYRDYNMNSVTR
jgi:guanosine-3',5'-bis(diphosphate) 3'-pyrophosphohydrolase